MPAERALKVGVWSNEELVGGEVGEGGVLLGLVSSVGINSECEEGEDSSHLMP